MDIMMNKSRNKNIANSIEKILRHCKIIINLLFILLNKVDFKLVILYDSRKRQCGLILHLQNYTEKFASLNKRFT